MEFYFLLALNIIFGVMPSLIWLSYYLAKDLHPEPKRMILEVFLFGMLATLPALLLQIILSGLLREAQVAFPLLAANVWLVDIIRWFIIIALTEELSKYLVVRLAILKNPALDEPLDLMLYMVVGALGFAALENMLYLLAPVAAAASLNDVLRAAALVSFIRFVGATFLHTLCAALVGYFMALSSLRTHKRWRLTIFGLTLATLLHGLYNFSIIKLPEPWSYAVPAGIIFFLVVFMVYDFDDIKKVKSICKL